MLNITSRLAVNIRYTPQEQFNWSDDRPQRSMESLTISDFMLSESDAEEMGARATSYMMRFLVTNFSAFSDLKFVPDETPLHPVVKTEVIPMKILFRDEKYISETIEILTKLVEDGKLCGEPQVSPIAKPTVAVTVANSHRLLWETSSHVKMLEAVNYGDRVKNIKQILFHGHMKYQVIISHTQTCSYQGYYSLHLSLLFLPSLSLPPSLPLSLSLSLQFNRRLPLLMGVP